MRFSYTSILLFVFSLLFCTIIFPSCSNTKYLSENETLYIGNKVTIQDDYLNKSDRKSLQKELSEIVRPKPNRKLLGVPFKLTFYNLAGEPKKEKGGIRNWIRNKLGEPPVLGEELSLIQNNNIFKNYLNNLGYFNAEISSENNVENKKMEALFYVNTGTQYKIKSLQYQQPDTSILSKTIVNSKDSSFIKIGQAYNFETIKSERERLDNIIKNLGYYYFSPEYLLAIADTTVGDHEVAIHMRLKYDEMPPNAFRRYSINKVSVYPNYRFTTTTNRPNRAYRAEDMVVTDKFTMYDRRKEFKPIVFTQAMQFKPGDFYNQRMQNMALNRIVSLDVFKFVKSEFKAVKDSSGVSKPSSIFDISFDILLQRGLLVNTPALLDVNYYLTPYPKKNFNIEFGAFTLNDSRAGSKLTFSWRNRNFFRGAELFAIKLNGGFEAQYGGIVRRPNTYNVGVEAGLTVPRFLVPFVNVKPSSFFVPKTIINTSFNYYSRSKLYEIKSLNLGLGYNWKEDAQKEHKFFPISITFVKTDTLDKNATIDINYSNLIYNGVIFGPTYEYTFNTQVGEAKRKNDFYFQGAAEFSGNVLGLIEGANFETNPKKILGTTYAQYIKLQTDFRYYRRLTENTSLASRLFLGYGYSYGNSRQLPNIKQFFSGGSASLRGFNSRLVGPGSFNEFYSKGTNTYIEMLGDIKMEANLEYRAKLYSIFHGAVFLDAGNIWLQRKNPDIPGGELTKNFYKEVAIDAGIGLRVDVSILILRLDFGMPIRKPWLPEGERWVFDKINFGMPEWRKENLIFSLAIGYPF